MRNGTPVLYLALIMAVAVLPGCEYVRLMRPSVLKQLDPGMVRMMNEMPKLDSPNEAIVGRLFVSGGLSHATEGDDGVMRQEIRIPEAELLFKPAIIVMPHGGELELEVSNDDLALHGIVLQSNGGEQFLPLVSHTRGRVKIELDGPGYYAFMDPLFNHSMQGMMGFIIVRGDVPREARLDRPQQPRP